MQAWQREEAALMDRVVALGDAIAQLDPTDMTGAQQMGQELTELEANEWTNLQHLAKRLMEIPNVEGVGQIVEKVKL
jgi:hypothetical protein